MSLSVVDGKGMSAVAKKADYQLFAYEPPKSDPNSASLPVIEVGKNESNRAQMEKIVADAAESIGSNLIVKIQAIDAVLPEDADMKVSKKSKMKVRHSEFPFLAHFERFPCCPSCEECRVSLRLLRGCNPEGVNFLRLCSF